MQIGMIGLGRLGSNIVRRLVRGQASAEGHVSWLIDWNATAEQYLTSSRSGEIYGKN
jgi:6-phosphogluconate dehydrogenase (decarboxylating)